MLDELEQYKELIAVNRYSHQYWPFIYLWGDTVILDAHKVVQIVGKSGTGKTTTADNAIRLSNQRLKFVSEHYIGFDTIKHTIVSRDRNFDNLPISLLIALNTTEERAFPMREMVLTEQYCIERLGLYRHHLEIIENDFNATAQALLDIIGSLG